MTYRLELPPLAPRAIDVLVTVHTSVTKQIQVFPPDSLKITSNIDLVVEKLHETYEAQCFTVISLRYRSICINQTITMLHILIIS